MHRLALLAGAMLLAACTAAQAGGPWRIVKDHWSEADERGYSQFVQALGETSVQLLGRSWSLGGLSGLLLYLLGFAGEVLMLTSLYMVMPAGRLSLRHALIGCVTAAVLWEITRRLLVWYLATLSQVSVVYGSMTTAIVVLLSLELAAALLLLGAQVIAEYERIGS